VNHTIKYRKTSSGYFWSATNTEGSSSKYYSMTLCFETKFSGGMWSLKRHYGKIGTKGVSTISAFGNFEAASREMSATIKQKTDKAYITRRTIKMRLVNGYWQPQIHYQQNTSVIGSVAPRTVNSNAILIINGQQISSQIHVNPNYVVV
jgi:predicted DNA-binding WGR domain protein